MMGTVLMGVGTAIGSVSTAMTLPIGFVAATAVPLAAMGWRADNNNIVKQSYAE